MTERQIVERLARLTPPIVVNRSTVSRDIEHVLANQRRVFRQGAFDVRAELGTVIAGIEEIVGKSFRDARAPPTDESAHCIKMALDAFGQLATLYQENGSMEPRDFHRPPDEDGRKVERIPTGGELHAMFSSGNVFDVKMVSDAETGVEVRRRSERAPRRSGVTPTWC